MGEFYVYMLCNPLKNDEPFYVGKGKDDRCQHHTNEAMKENYTDKNHHKIRTIKKILASGFVHTIIKVDVNLTEDQSFELEEFLIPFIGRSDLNLGPLTNMTNGGEGLSGLIRDISGENNPNYGKRGEDSIWWGKSHTDGTKKKQSEKQKGKVLTEDHKQNMRKPKSEEGRKNMAQARLDSNYVATKEHKQKLSDAGKGVPKSKTPCDCCGMLCAAHLINRFHNKNCKVVL
jgi:hypothetical protein